MPTVSINWLSRHTGKDRRTIKKRLDKLPQDLKGKFDSVAALEAIYCGTAIGENGFISTPEAIRLLTLAKKEQVELQNQVMRGKYYERDAVHFLYKHVFAIVTQTLKGNRDRLLTIDTINDIFEQFRNAADDLQAQGDALWKEYEKEETQKLTDPVSRRAYRKADR